MKVLLHSQYPLPTESVHEMGHHHTEPACLAPQTWTRHAHIQAVQSPTPAGPHGAMLTGPLVIVARITTCDWRPTDPYQVVYYQSVKELHNLHIDQTEDMGECNYVGTGLGYGYEVMTV